MEYTALYRKFRPLKFEEITGQEHVTKTLKNQVIADRVGHAYLFNGGRGTGKTSAAKILARAVNCLNPKEGEPCNECEICKMALTGNLPDIMELDAASNNKVEDIRAIVEEVNFLPTTAKYRVYIIDEAHMLTTGAFNALLKTLEEPPKHVKFILATTEPQKILPTILSRCQKFNFKKISNENICERLKYICDKEGITITHEALRLIAVLSEGAMRDALSILERCIQDGVKDIGQDKIKELVGIPNLRYIEHISKAMIEYNPDFAIKTMEEVIDEGKDLEYFLWEIIKYIKDLLVYKTTSKLEIYSDEELKVIEDLTRNISKERLLKIIYDLSEMESNIKKSSQKTIMFQAGIIKLCTNTISTETGLEELKQKIVELENQIKQIASMPSKSVTYQAPSRTYEVDTRQAPSVQQPKTKQAVDVQKKVENIETNNSRNTQQNSKVTQKNGESNSKKINWWGEIIEQFKDEGKIMIYTNLIRSEAVELNDMMVGIRFPQGLNKFGKAILEKTENQMEIRKKVSQRYGKDMLIKLILEEKAEEKKAESDFESLVKSLDIPMDIIDE